MPPRLDFYLLTHVTTVMELHELYHRRGYNEMDGWIATQGPKTGRARHADVHHRSSSPQITYRGTVTGPAALTRRRFLYDDSRRRPNHLA